MLIENKIEPTTAKLVVMQINQGKTLSWLPLIFEEAITYSRNRSATNVSKTKEVGIDLRRILRLDIIFASNWPTLLFSVLLNNQAVLENMAKSSSA